MVIGIQDDDLKLLKKIMEAPRTIAEISFNMNWAYSTTSQRTKILEAGGVVKKIHTTTGTRYIIPNI